MTSLLSLTHPDSRPRLYALRHDENNLPHRDSRLMGALRRLRYTGSATSGAPGEQIINVTTTALGHKNQDYSEAEIER